MKCTFQKNVVFFMGGRKLLWGAFSLLLLFLSLKSFGQPAEVFAVFEKYGLESSILDPSTRARPENWSFDYKLRIIANGREKTSLAHFDHTKPEAERWTLLSVDGKPATEKEIKNFKKQFSKPVPKALKIDTTTLKVEQLGSDKLVISYKLDARVIPEEQAFLKDCRTFLSINLGSRRLEKVRTVNEKPVKVSILNTPKLELVAMYSYHDPCQCYLPDSEDMSMLIRMLGQTSPTQTISEYSNYSR